MSKKELTKDKIKQVFWDLYEINPIEKITVTKVCKLANINRSTFYKYFCDTYEVLETIENTIFPPIEMLPQFNSTNKQTTFDIKTHWNLLQEQKKYLKVLLSENGDPAFRFKFIEFIRPMVLEMVKEKEHILNANYLLEFTLCGVMGAFAYYINNDIDNDGDYIFNTIVELVEKIYY